MGTALPIRMTKGLCSARLCGAALTPCPGSPCPQCSSVMVMSCLCWQILMCGCRGGVRGGGSCSLQGTLFSSPFSNLCASATFLLIQPQGSGFVTHHYAKQGLKLRLIPLSQLGGGGNQCHHLCRTLHVPGGVTSRWALLMPHDGGGGGFALSQPFLDGSLCSHIGDAIEEPSGGWANPSFFQAR